MLRSVMTPGSYLVISHATMDDVSPEEYADGVAVYEKASSPVVPRCYAEVLKFFDGMDLADPGLVSIGDWRTNGLQPVRQLVYGGVARQRLTARSHRPPGHPPVRPGSARKEPGQ